METDIFTILLFGVIIALIGAFLLVSFETIFRLGQNLIEKNRDIEAEIIERKKAQAEIEVSLKEKELLLQEVHHRVKNNMQIVASLLQLQSRRIVDDPKTVAILNDSRSRVNAMSLIHETLYNPSNLSSVGLREYIKELALNLFDFYGVDPDRIALVTDVESISLNIETATPCGLIVNELVTNSLKYAFPDERQGVITITMKRNQDGTGYLLEVADDGIGLPEGLDIRRTNSLGMQLVVNLTETQLQGRLKMTRHPGTAFHITFQEIGYAKRI